MRRLNKKAQGLSVSMLVIIVLAIVVLVVLALGFGAGWSNLWSKVTGFFSPVNVDSVKQACQFACVSQAQHDYCCRDRSVRFSKDGKKETLKCSEDGRIRPADCDLSCQPCDTTTKQMRDCWKLSGDKKSCIKGESIEEGGDCPSGEYDSETACEALETS